jgi:hypothetical protein
VEKFDYSSSYFTCFKCGSEYGEPYLGCGSDQSESSALLEDIEFACASGVTTCNVARSSRCYSDFKAQQFLRGRYMCLQPDEFAGQVEDDVWVRYHVSDCRKDDDRKVIISTAEKSMTVKTFFVRKILRWDSMNQTFPFFQPKRMAT